MPTAGGLDKAVRNGHAIGCTAIQVFTSSPQQWAAKPVTEEQVSKLRTALDETGIGQSIVSHDSYLINLCAPDLDKREQSYRGLLGELGRCHQYGIPFVVSHMGAHMGAGPEAGLGIVAEMTKRLLAEAPTDVTLLMETTAGQGSSLNSNFEELATILELTGGPAKLGICLDTCHVFAAGYDIRTREGYEAMITSFDQLIGLDRLHVLHVNGSKKALGTRVDRHAHLGEGEIGPDAFSCLMQDARLTDKIFVVETPEAETMHAENVRRLWNWAEG